MTRFYQAAPPSPHSRQHDDSMLALPTYKWHTGGWWFGALHVTGWHATP